MVFISIEILDHLYGEPPRMYKSGRSDVKTKAALTRNQRQIHAYKHNVLKFMAVKDKVRTIYDRI